MTRLHGCGSHMLSESRFSYQMVDANCREPMFQFSFVIVTILFNHFSLNINIWVFVVLFCPLVLQELQLFRL